jgi:hypothetical protein
MDMKNFKQELAKEFMHVAASAVSSAVFAASGETGRTLAATETAEAMVAGWEILSAALSEFPEESA